MNPEDAESEVETNRKFGRGKTVAIVALIIGTLIAIPLIVVAYHAAQDEAECRRSANDTAAARALKGFGLNTDASNNWQTYYDECRRMQRDWDERGIPRRRERLF